MVGHGANRQSVIAAMMDIVDHYHVMSYNTDPTKNVARAAPAIARADSVGKTRFVHAGVETNRGIGAKVSYGDAPGKQTAAAVLADMSVITQQLRRHPSFAGIDIHDWSSLRDLGPR